MTRRDPAETRLATGFRSAEESPGLLLWQLTNSWQARQRAALRPHDLTHVQFVLLATLTYAADDGPLSQRQLADAARTDVMMTSQVVRALAAKDLVRRATSPTDGRAVAVSPTPAGTAVANRAVLDVEEVDRVFFAALGDRLPAFVGMVRDLVAPPPAGHPLAHRGGPAV